MTGSTPPRAQAIPASAGIGLRAPHTQHLLDTLPKLDWVEVHSENYFGHGIPLQALKQVRETYAISLHGVGLSVGSTDVLDAGHLAQLRRLIDCIEPGLVSEHLSWSSVDGQYFNDLLPLPYTDEALAHVSERLTVIQERLGRRILIENISSYLQLCASAIPEWEFLTALAERTGCGILLDVNNLYVNATNHGIDPHRYLQSLPVWAVHEIHLAGFTRKSFEDGEILIDTHSRRVDAEVWQLYAEAIARFGPTPTLIEWDSDLPPLQVLLDEAAKAQTMMEGKNHVVTA